MNGGKKMRSITKSDIKAGIFCGIGALVAGYFNSPNEISVRDINNDSKPDVIIESRAGIHSTYIQQEGGNTIPLDRYLQTRQDFLKAQTEAYRDSIGAKVEE